MMRLLGLLMLVSVTASAQMKPSLGPAAADGLQRLAARVNRGTLGPEVVSVTYQAIVADHQATLDLHRRDGAIHRLTLLYPQRGLEVVRPRFFKLVPDPEVTPSELDAVTALLDETFPRSPWVLPWASASTGNDATLFVDRPKELALLLFLGLTMLGGGVAIWRASPAKER